MIILVIGQMMKFYIFIQRLTSDFFYIYEKSIVREL